MGHLGTERDRSRASPLALKGLPPMGARNMGNTHRNRRSSRLRVLAHVRANVQHRPIQELSGVRVYPYGFTLLGYGSSLMWLWVNP